MQGSGLALVNDVESGVKAIALGVMTAAAADEQRLDRLGLGRFFFVLGMRRRRSGEECS